MKDLAGLPYILGIEATFHNGTFHLSQQKFIVDVLKRHFMDGVKPLSTPCTIGSKLSNSTGHPMEDPSLYRRAIDALQYLTVARPDIQYAVNQACKFQHAPPDVHWTADKKFLDMLNILLLMVSLFRLFEHFP